MRTGVPAQIDGVAREFGCEEAGVLHSGRISDHCGDAAVVIRVRRVIEKLGPGPAQRVDQGRHQGGIPPFGEIGDGPEHATHLATISPTLFGWVWNAQLKITTGSFDSVNPSMSGRITP